MGHRPGSAELGLPAQLEAVLEARPPIFSFTFGIPGASALADRGIKLLGTATTVEEARRLEAAGVDVVVAQGSEAGSHCGTFAVSVRRRASSTVADFGRSEGRRP